MAWIIGLIVFILIITGVTIYAFVTAGVLTSDGEIISKKEYKHRQRLEKD